MSELRFDCSGSTSNHKDTVIFSVKFVGNDGEWHTLTSSEYYEDVPTVVERLNLINNDLTTLQKSTNHGANSKTLNKGYLAGRSQIDQDTVELALSLEKADANSTKVHKLYN